VATAGDPGPIMGVFTEQLRELMHEDEHIRPRDPANSTHAVSRVTLRRLLLAGLSEVVHFDKAFVRYEQTDDGKVRAYFADGTSATGDVLVGADGMHSRVRRQFLPNAALLDLRAIGVGGKLALTESTAAWLPKALITNKNMILPPRHFLFTSIFRRRESSQQVARRLGEQMHILSAPTTPPTTMRSPRRSDGPRSYPASRRRCGATTGSSLAPPLRPGAAEESSSAR
jgi:hypothetical protein